MPPASRSMYNHAIAVILLLVTSYALGAPPATKAGAATKRTATPATAKPVSLAELPAACRAAKSVFRPLTPTDLQAVKKELTDAVARLEQKSKAEGPPGAERKKTLQWDRIGQEVGRPQPDLALLAELHANYLSGQEGLSQAWYLDVRDALDRYLKIADAVRHPDRAKGAYERLLDDLAGHLEKFAAASTPDEALLIGGAVGTLEDVRQAPEFVAAIRRHFVQPNLLIRVSAEVATAGMTGPVDDVRPIHDYILKTDIRGTGRTKGQTTARLLPDRQRAVVETYLKATAKTTAVGENGPVCVYSHSTSRIEGSKRVWIDAGGLSAKPAVAHVATNTTIDAIAARRGCKLVERMAWNRACKQKALAECIASRHTEQKVCQQIDAEAAAPLSKANEAFQQRFRKPLRDFRLFPQRLAFSTTADALDVTSLLADASQLAAVGPPPKLQEAAPAMTLLLHQSTLNNMAATALAGMLLREERMQDIMLEVLDEVPDQFLADDEQAPWAIRFGKALPIELTFADDGFRVVLRGESFYRGRTAYPGMTVTARYKFVKGPNGYTAVREPLEVYPPKFDPQGKESLSPAEVTAQTLVTNRFNRIFKREMALEGFVLPGRWEKLGALRPVEVVARDGWLAVAWKRVPGKSGTAGGKAAAADVAKTGGGAR